MPYVEFDELGRVIGVYARPQEGKDLTWVDGEVKLWDEET